MGIPGLPYTHDFPNLVMTKQYHGLQVLCQQTVLANLKVTNQN